MRKILAILAALGLGLASAQASTVNLASPSGTVGMSGDGTNLLPVGAICGAASATLEANCAYQLYIDSSGYAHVSITNTSLAVTGTFWQTTQPVSLSTLPALVAGSAIIGKVGIDQTTVGTTNGVSLTQIGANTVLTGSGAVGTGSARVAVGTDTATIAGSAPSTVLQTNNAQWGGTAITNVPTPVGTVGTGNTPTVNAYIVGGGGSGGTSSSFNVTFPFTGTAAGAEYLSSPPTLTSGQMVALQTTNQGSLHTTVDNTNANGSATSANSSPVVIASDQAAVATKAASGAFVAGSIADLAHGQGTMANSVPVAIASNQSSIPTTSATNVGANDCSGSIITGGTAQNAFTAQTGLHGFTIKNIDASSGSGEPLWISFTTTAAASTAASYPLAAPAATTFASGESFTAPPGFGFNHALSVIAATTGHKFSCTWW